MAISKSQCHLPLFLCILGLVVSLISTTQAQVPQNQIFTFVNQGEFGDYITEYDASYRIIQTLNLKSFAFPFQLCFYNTTPGAYILAIRAGRSRDEDIMKWVWDANRNHPVGENSTFSLSKDGNLVIAEANGHIVWQTNTAKKGVTGLQLLPNGNMVLHDKKGNLIWQSFDYPTDTLLVGQSLRINNINKLVSRKSDSDGSDGQYSLVLDHKGLILYLNNSGQLIQYGGWRVGDLRSNVTFNVEPENEKATAYELVLNFNAGQTNSRPNGRHLLQSRPISSGNTYNLNKLNYNATISYLRLGSDGSLKAYTYYSETGYLTWAESFAYFSSYFVRECALPSKCGAFGLCDKRMCVACPTPKGLLGWSESCEPPKLKRPCKVGSNNKVDYYKIVGVEHFLSPILDDGDGPMKVEECKAKCDKDCKCLGFFYKQDTSKCLLAPLLETLIKDVNTSVGYIKYSK